MHGSSSELLLDQQQDLLKRRKLLELSGKSENVVIPKKRTCKDRLKFYTTSILAMAVSGGSAALLFLVPLYVDPAVSTLMSDFDPEPVTCETSQVEWFVGFANCSWSSCREGCTSDLYKCTHIQVLYSPNSDNNETSIRLEATLLVNIKGCGYPPQIQCSEFWELYAKEGTKFPCHYSRRNTSLVMPNYSRTEHVNTIAHFFLIPFVVTAIASVGLCLLHCDCSCSNQRRKDVEAEAARAAKRRRRKQIGSQIEDASEATVSISRVETMTPRGDDDDEELTVSSSIRPL